MGQDEHRVGGGVATTAMEMWVEPSRLEEEPKRLEEEPKRLEEEEPSHHIEEQPSRSNEVQPNRSNVEHTSPPKEEPSRLKDALDRLDRLEADTAHTQPDACLPV